MARKSFLIPALAFGVAAFPVLASAAEKKSPEKPTPHFCYYDGKAFSVNATACFENEQGLDIIHICTALNDRQDKDWRAVWTTGVINAKCKSR
ncbi:MAG: hypothetical protein AAFX54_03205 [Pseudomonadota bacterium]